MNWNEFAKIRIVESTDAQTKHLIVKTLLSFNILRKYHDKKKYIEVYSEFPIGDKIVDIFFKNNLTKEIICYEIESSPNESRLNELKEIYKDKELDLILIDLSKLSDNIDELNNQIKDLIC